MSTQCSKTNCLLSIYLNISWFDTYTECYTQQSVLIKYHSCCYVTSTDPTHILINEYSDSFGILNNEELYACVTQLYIAMTSQ